MTEYHRLVDRQFRELSRGYGGAEAVTVLRNSRLSKHLLLLRCIARAWPGPPAEREAALSALADAQAQNRAAVDEILADPIVGAWAARTCRRILASVYVDVDLGHLGAIAAAAATRCGSDADVLTPARDGFVMLPTVGAVAVNAARHQPVRVRVRSGEVSVEHEAGAWYRVRRLRSGDAGYAVVLEDTDPYRGGHHVAPAGRLTDAEFDDWQELFAKAWRLLTTYAPERADEIAVGLRTLVPLVHGAPGSADSATMRDAFGAFGLTRPESGTSLALTIVHEFQHSKLSAIVDLMRLYDAKAPDTYFAPWREDPRPVGGLYQGTYAFLAVADMWHRLRTAPDGRAAAEHQFAAARVQVDAALTTLLELSSLTALGRRFANGMRSTLDALHAIEVPDAVLVRAQEELRRNRVAWQERNGRAP